MHSRQNQRAVSRSTEGSFLYRIFSMALAVAVLTVQIMLPLAPVFANEEPPVSSPPSSDTVSDSSSTETEEDVSTPDVSDSEASVETNESSENDDPETAASIEGDTEDPVDAPEESVLEENGQTESGVDDSEEIPNETPVALEDTPAPEVVGEVVTPTETPEPGEVLGATSTEEENATSTPDTSVETPENESAESPTTTVSEEEVVNELEEEPEIIEQEEDTEEVEEIVDETAVGTTTETTVVMPELHTVLADESQYTFNINDCARVADGSFYCTKKNEETEVFEDRVFAAPDADGDSEIYIEKNGELRQLTYNTDDDAAPFYDDRSKTIVFHRLVNARYQIISLDLTTGEEEQLTFDSYNNMQPSRYGDLIVWQGWVGNDWEVLMSEDDEIRMLTDNATHDIGPRINGEYIIWQAEKDDGWEVRVYNTLTGMTETIDDTNGASIENPRLVLVYDAKHENGDVETRGYDLVTGKNIALHSEAPVLPDELPDPDQTGEERALINATQQKIKSEDEEGESVLPPPDPEPVAPEPVVEGGDALIIPPFDTATSTASMDDYSSSSLPIPQIEDLVIPAIEETTSVPPIPDLEVTTFEGSTTTEPDSQA